MATTQGEIRVGSSHQAQLPPCRNNVSPGSMSDSPEVIQWKPSSVVDTDLVMYLRAARSMAAFAGMCDGGATDDGCQAASMDDTTINALDTLHRNNYDTAYALQELVRRPVPRSVDKKWTEDESKRFVKGIKQHGKNFFKIQKDYLPFKDTGDLIEYYYYWKKTPAAANNRPHRRVRKGNAFRKQQRTPQPQSDSSSASSDNESDDDSSDTRELNQFRCRRCFTNISKDPVDATTPVSKDKEKLNFCAACTAYIKNEPLEPSAYMFKPVKPEPNTAQVNGDATHRQDLTGVSSPDNLDSAVDDSSSVSSKELDNRKSPSSNSVTSSTSSSDKDSTKDSDSSSDSSGSDKDDDEEEAGIETDVENNQDDLSSSASSTTSPTAEVTSASSGSSAATATPVKPELDGSVVKPLPTSGIPVTAALLQQALPSSTTAVPSVPVLPPGIPVPAIFPPTQPSGASVLRHIAPLATAHGALPPSVLHSGLLSGIPVPPGSQLMPGLSGIQTPGAPTVGVSHHNGTPPSVATTSAGAAAIASSTASIATAATSTSGPIAVPPTTAASPMVISSEYSIYRPTVPATALQCYPPGHPCYTPRPSLSDVSTTRSSPVVTSTDVSKTASPGPRPFLSHVDLTQPPTDAKPPSTTLASGSVIQNKPPTSASTTVASRLNGSGLLVDPRGSLAHPPLSALSQHGPLAGRAGLSQTSVSLSLSSSSMPSLSTTTTTTSALSGGTNLPGNLPGMPPPSHVMSPFMARPPVPLSAGQEPSGTLDSIKSEPGLGSKDANSPHSAKLHPSIPGPPPALTSKIPISAPPGPTIGAHPSGTSANIPHLGMAPLPGSMQRLPTPPPLTQAPAVTPSTSLSAVTSQRDHIPGPPPMNLPPMVPPHHIKQELPSDSQHGSIRHGPSDAPQARPRSRSRSPHRPPPTTAPPPTTSYASHGAPSPHRRMHSPIVPIPDPESDEDRGTPSPGPDARVVDEEFTRSERALFVKHLSRGYNSCLRTDIQFRPLPGSALAKKREERHRRASLPAKEETRQHNRHEEEKNRKRPESPPANTTADAQVISNVLPSQPLPPYSNDRHTPGRIGPGIGPTFDPTPALRQLSEYARPHAALAGQDPSRSLPYSSQSLPLPPHIDPVLQYRASMFPPGSRERLELELQRDKQERDARERELREREIRDMELREKMKQELEMKPPGMDHPQWLELQRSRFSQLPHTAFPPGHIPGVYPPSSLASDLIQRERERFERLGVERLSAERAHAERMEYIARLQMAGMSQSQAVAAAAHTHTHAHAHTHLHLHQPGQELSSLPGLYPGGPPHMFPPGFAPPGADPLAGGAPPAPPLGPHMTPHAAAAAAAAAGLPQSHLLNAAAREQEIMYRDLLSRPPYSTDPLLAQQLTAQAAAQHEALQRMALERERERLGGPPMH